MQTNDLDEIQVGRPVSERNDTEETGADASGKKTKLNKNGKPRKQGSGRKEGSYSMAQVSLEALNELFASGKAKITVGRKWAEAVGLTVDKCTEAGKLLDHIEGTTPATAGKFVFGDPDEM